MFPDSVRNWHGGHCNKKVGGCKKTEGISIGGNSNDIA